MADEEIILNKLFKFSVYMFVLALAFVGLICFPWGKLLQKEKEQVAAKTIEEKTVAVLGATTKACPTKDEYTKRVKQFRPEIVLRFGTEEERLNITQLFSCLDRVNELKNNAQCKAYEVVLKRSCLEELFKTSVRFLEPQEMIRNTNTGMVVYSRINDSVVDYPNLAAMLVDVYKDGTAFGDITSDSVLIKSLILQVPVIKDLPNTDGKVANRYIEFDGSRQLMFLWEQAKYKTFRISGAFPEYNPVGVFTILNKSPLAWSSTANKWMPYWQAFTFDKKQQAMLGIHALVYWYPGFTKTGEKKIFEPESHIGTPRSTGCLRLTAKDAKKVFEWSKVGDVVVVHD